MLSMGSEASASLLKGKRFRGGRSEVLDGHGGMSAFGAFERLYGFGGL